ncbi:MAG: hypothetical protein IJI09_11640 [Clostridia bacterium]|nr:hypothetical protein [Clostridia bacterium]
MKTVSFGIANYCVPCHAHCRYCLLSSCGKSTGVEQKTGMAFAKRVIQELFEARSDLTTNYYCGYCMDMPELPEYIRFCREHHSPGAKFLQMNGFAFRNGQELRNLMNTVRENGVELIDLTFFGTEEYHDRFAGRQGDFRFLMKMLDASKEAELSVNVSIPLLRENLGQMPELHRMLSGRGGRKFSFFLPHSKGRGKTVLDYRITRQEFDALPEEIRNAFARVRHMTEAEWLSSGEIADSEKRNLTLVLTPGNMERLNTMPAADVLNELESMDDRYLREMPSARELAERYGDPANQQLFRLRDLLLKWQQQYIADTGNILYDMHDETHHFSVHL